MNLVFLDGDRCYWRTDRFMEIIYETLERHGISRQHMAHLKTETERAGKAFDTIDALRKAYDSALVTEIVREVEMEAVSRQHLPYDDEKCLLMSGIRELVAVIPPQERVVLTRGGEELQLLKLRSIAGIDTERDQYEITDREDKGALLAESFQADEELFVFSWIRNSVGDIKASHVTLVEDKAAAFAGFERLGERAGGYWYRNPTEPQIPSQALPEGMTLPSNVIVIDSLYTVRDALASA